MSKRLVATGLLLASSSLLANSPIYHTTLQNGLKVYVVEDKRAPIVLNSLWYRVGSSYEHNGITGISHMLEHMMFRGTTKHAPGEYDKILNHLGSQQNAITSYDHTVYYQVSGKQNIDKLLELEADRMRGLKLDPQLFTKEKQVVREERRMRTDDSPVGLAYQQLWATAFSNNPGHHPVIGWASDIKNYKLDDLKNWYNQWYQPNNAFLLVIGDVDHKKIFKLANQYFGHIPAKPLPVIKPRNEIQLPTFTQQHLGIPSNTHLVLVGYKVPTLVTADKPQDAYTVSVINQLLGVGTGSLLYDDLVHKKQIATGAESVYTSPFLHHNGLLITYLLPADGVSNEQTLKAFRHQINKVKNGDFTDADLERAKNSLLAGQQYELDDFDTTLHQYGLYAIANMPMTERDQLAAKIKPITRADIQRIAQKYLNNSNKTVVIVDKTQKDKSA